MKRILIAEDHAIVRVGAKHVIQSLWPDCEVTGVDSFNKAISCLEENQYDLMILDINIPGGNSLNMIKSIKKIQEKIRILIFSGYNEKLYAVPALQAGADGYVSKDASKSEFTEALQSIFQDKKYLSPTMQQESINKLIDSKQNVKNPLSTLSNRETEILQLILKGHSTSQIGDTLFLHLSTVSTYKMRIFEKLGVKNIVELIDQIQLNEENGWNLKL
jgi:two-component system invasion response regulator UvrY